MFHPRRRLVGKAGQGWAGVGRGMPQDRLDCPGEGIIVLRKEGDIETVFETGSAQSIIQGNPSSARAVKEREQGKQTGRRVRVEAASRNSPVPPARGAPRRVSVRLYMGPPPRDRRSQGPPLVRVDPV